MFSLTAHLGLKCSANATLPHRCRICWLFLAPICSFVLISCLSASPRFLFPPHSTPQNCKFFSNTNFPFEPPTFRAVSHAGRAREAPGRACRAQGAHLRFKKVVPTAPRPSATAPGPALPLHPAGPFPLPPLPAPLRPSREA